MRGECQFSDAIPRSLNASEASYIDDMLRVIEDQLFQSLQEYDELTALLPCNAARGRAGYAAKLQTATEAEKLFDRAHELIMERCENRTRAAKLEEIDNLPDNDAIPALEALIAEMEAAA